MTVIVPKSERTYLDEYVRYEDNTYYYTLDAKYSKRWFWH